MVMSAFDTLVRNPEDKFSHDEAKLSLCLTKSSKLKNYNEYLDQDWYPLSMTGVLDNCQMGSENLGCLRADREDSAQAGRWYSLEQPHNEYLLSKLSAEEKTDI